MAKPKGKKGNSQARIENSGLVVEQQITKTLEVNYMPYAMSVIVSRALPEIDGFKPSHRKILYTMYKMGLLGNTRTKSAKVVGQTMQIHPHGEAAIYEAMVRMTRGQEALLHPYIDSKGNFGKVYSRDMSYAASRYTEVKLEQISAELFADIDKDTVTFVPNYDNTMDEPTLLPVKFPTVLTNLNLGIAVGMASSICSFNLSEICDTTIALIKDEHHPIKQTLIAPDFPGGGKIIQDTAELSKIYETGRGQVRVRATYSYDKAENCIDVTQIPPTTTVEAIIDRLAEMIKSGRLKEVTDVRDETDLGGLKLTIDLRKNVDPDKLMLRLYRLTQLEDVFSCNFNVLVEGYPQVMGVREILQAWLQFREQAVRRRTLFDLKGCKDKLHLLKGLAAILVDIDKAIKIVRETDEDSMVIPNLMIGFGIDNSQAEYVANIRLRQLNRDYILRRTEEIESLQSKIDELTAISENPSKIRAIIASELKEVKKKYGIPRKSEVIEPTAEHVEEEAPPDYAVSLFFTNDGYFKKIQPQALRNSPPQKLKEGDSIKQTLDSKNHSHLLFFTNMGQVYKSRGYEWEDSKASSLGDFAPAKLGMDKDEQAMHLVVTDDYSGELLFLFQNGKIARVPLSAYVTKSNRKKLTGAYSTKSPIVAILHLEQETDITVTSSAGRRLLLSSALIPLKTTRDSLGVQVMSLRSAVTTDLKVYAEGELEAPHRYRPKALPAAGR